MIIASGIPSVPFKDGCGHDDTTHGHHWTLPGAWCTPPINEALSSKAPEAVGDQTQVSRRWLPCEAPVICFDADGDGFGDDLLQTQACEVPSGHGSAGTDDLDAMLPRC